MVARVAGAGPHAWMSAIQDLQQQLDALRLHLASGGSMIRQESAPRAASALKSASLRPVAASTPPRYIPSVTAPLTASESDFAPYVLDLSTELSFGF